jgi:hypothetical protein
MLGDANRYTEIAAASGISDPNLIRPGQRLSIPGSRPQPPVGAIPQQQPVPQSGDTLSAGMPGDFGPQPTSRAYANQFGLGLATLEYPKGVAIRVAVPRQKMACPGRLAGTQRRCTGTIGSVGEHLADLRQKFYISTQHSDADVDRTLEAVEGAFAAIANT